MQPQSYAMCDGRPPPVPIAQRAGTLSLSSDTRTLRLQTEAAKRTSRPDAYVHSIAQQKSSLPMELRHLRYFVAVAEELSITRGAARLRLAQPSLTRQIKNLEAELRVQLFIREKGRIALTEQGKFFLERTRRLLAQSALDVQDVRRRGPASGSGSRTSVTQPICTTTCCRALWVPCGKSGPMLR